MSPWLIARTPTQARVIKILGWVIVAGVIFYLPLHFDLVRVLQFNKVAYFGLAALGLGLLTGFNGQISLGHGAFFGIGAYTTAILVTDHHWPHLLTLVAAFAITFVVGAIVGLPALRIHGLYLALVTLALATVFPILVQRYRSFTGGSQGKNVPKFTAPDWTGLENDQWQYYVTVGVVVIGFVLVRNLVKSRSGRALIAIRDHEVAAEVLGVNLAVYKVLAFGVSAALAGVAGGLFVFSESFVSSRSFALALSITLLAAMVLGGVATIVGPAIGAFFIVFTPEVSDAISERIAWVEGDQLSLAVFGSLLIVAMLVAPDGALGLLRRGRALLIRLVHRPPTPEPGPSVAAE